MKLLRIAKELDLPLDAVTQKLAWLGRTGSGKTFACKRMVEQMLYAGAQVVIIDAAGVWPGLRLGPHSFDIPVLGGLHGDIPLEPTAGALIADVIVQHGTSMVLDVSQMLDAERTRFATAFGGRFFQLKKASPSAVHLVLEECQEFVPQNFQSGEERMLHEFVRLSKQGRALGVGISFLSQRPQEINKKALNQSECVFAFQMTGPQERKALEYWLADKGFDGKLSDILPRLEVGAPHVWSPQWLKISKTVHILPIDSLDTSRTPKVGEKKFTQKKLKPIDLGALNEAMKESVEKAKAEDPKTLKARIAELEKELIKKHPIAKPERIEVPMFDKKAFEELRKEVLDHISLANGNVKGALHVYMSKCLESHGAKPGSVIGREWHGNAAELSASFNALRHDAALPRAAKQAAAAQGPPKKPKERSDGTVEPIGGGLRRMMIALAQRPGGLTNRQLGVRAGLSSRSGTFSTYLSRGRSQGWIIDEGDLRRLSPEGEEALGDWQPLPEGRALLDYWLAELGGGANRMLSALADAYPKALTNDELGVAANISARSGTFSTYLSKLRTLELVTGRGSVRISKELL